MEDFIGHDAVDAKLIDQRNPLRLRHSLASQLRTLVLQRAKGWINLSEIDMLRRDSPDLLFRRLKNS